MVGYTKSEIYHLNHFLILIFIVLFIYFWLCWVFIAPRVFSRCGVSGCGAQAPGEQASVVVAPGLWSTGSAVVAHASPAGSVVKNPRADARVTRDAGSIPGLRRSPGERNGDPLQYSCLENFADRGA